MIDNHPEPQNESQSSHTGEVDPSNGQTELIRDMRENQHLSLDPDNVEKGLAQLVLTLIELLRQLLERQAVRRMEAGQLTDAQIERMGITFSKLEEKMNEFLDYFGLKKEDLNIDLGPLGDLL